MICPRPRDPAAAAGAGAGAGAGGRGGGIAKGLAACTPPAGREGSGGGCGTLESIDPDTVGADVDAALAAGWAGGVMTKEVHGKW